MYCLHTLSQAAHNFSPARATIECTVTRFVRQNERVPMAEFAPHLETADPVAAERMRTLETIEQRLLWLSTLIIHHANSVRSAPPRPRRASSLLRLGRLDHDRASLFPFSASGDRAAIAARLAGLSRRPVLAWPPSPGIPDPIAQLCARRLPQPHQRPRPRRLLDRLGRPRRQPRPSPPWRIPTPTAISMASPHRFIALVGHRAELDEGNVWEAILDTNTPRRATS